jgi:hypothetical protein
MNKSILFTTFAILAAVGSANAAETRMETKAPVGADSTVRQQTGTPSAMDAGSRTETMGARTAMAGTMVGMGWAGSSTATN